MAPTFSHPTIIDNPLFPIGQLRSAVLIGKLEGRPWRAETTLLPYTRFVDWNGQHVETLESQFIAFLDGRIFEVAVDHYAQADDGSVWYLGEDAFTYENGAPKDTEGTWLAGVDGPPALIMPARPVIGQVYRTENIPGLVFEQVTVKAIGTTVDGPTGLVGGAMVAQELHMDEVRLEDKVFAPGYGEFHSGQGSTYESTALAIPADALGQPLATQLTAMLTGATEVFDAAESKSWPDAAAGLDAMNAAWSAFDSSGTPSQLAQVMREALHVLKDALTSRSRDTAGLAALDAAQVVLDLQLRYRPASEIDLIRLELWTRALEADAAAGDQADARGDATTLQWVRDRLALEPDVAGPIDDWLRTLQAAADSGELPFVRAAAARLRSAIAAAQPGR